MQRDYSWGWEADRVKKNHILIQWKVALWIQSVLGGWRGVEGESGKGGGEDHHIREEENLLF